MNTAASIAAAGTVARLLIASWAPIGTDEAYYFEWGKNLHSGYYDHPPAVALLAAVGRWLAGPLGMLIGARAPAIVLFAAATALLFILVRQWHGAEAAVTTVALVQVTPVFSLGGLLLMPDAPLTFFWLLAIWTFEHAIRSRPASARAAIWWSATGLALGLGLLSKYNAALLIFIFIGYLATTPDHRRWLLRIEPVLALAIALLVFSPTLLWNADHGWASLRYQAQHGLGRGRIDPLGPISAIAGQAAYVSPLLWFGGLWASLRSKNRLLGWLTWLPIIFFTIAAAFGKSLPYWPALGYMGATIALAADRGLWRSRRALSMLAIAIGLIFTLMTPIQETTGVLPLPLNMDPTSELTGWPEVADQTRRSLAELRKSRAAFVFARHWISYAELSFQLPEEKVHCLTGRRTTAYDFFEGYEGRVGEDGLEVHPMDLNTPEDPSCLGGWEDAGTLSTGSAGRARIFRFRICRAYVARTRT